MEIAITVTLKTNGGLEIGTFMEMENDTPAHLVPAEILNMAVALSEGRDLAGILRNPPPEASRPEGYGARTIGEIMQMREDAMYYPHDWDREDDRPPAPSIPRRTPLERAIASGETRAPGQPTARVYWHPGDTVKLNEVSAAIFNTPPIRRRILMQIARERQKQTGEHGWTAAHDDTHAANDWIAIIVRELGAALYTDNTPQMREAMIRVAAVAAAAVESLDRKDPEVREVLARQQERREDGD